MRIVSRGAGRARTHQFDAVNRLLLGTAAQNIQCSACASDNA
jgi:hypothetical protein